MDDATRQSSATIYTDGSCLRNGQHNNDPQAGIGVFWPDKQSNNVSEPLAAGRQTNNRAEIKAVHRGITQAKEQGYQNLKIKLDSKYVIDGVRRTPKYSERGWKGVANTEELKELRKSMDGIQVEFEYVPSSENQAHRLAFAAAKGVDLVKRIVRRIKSV